MTVSLFFLLRHHLFHLIRDPVAFGFLFHYFSPVTLNILLLVLLTIFTHRASELLID